MSTHNHADGPDLVVSLDAFKVTRPGVGGPLGEMGRWKVSPLTPWARDLLRRETAGESLALNEGQPYATRGGDGFINATRGDLDRGAVFELRNHAISFLRDIAEMAETGWSS